MGKASKPGVPRRSVEDAKAGLPAVLSAVGRAKAEGQAKAGDPAAKFVEIAPGRFTLTPAGRSAPDVVMCRALPNGDGTWRLCPESVTWARMNGELLKALGLANQWQTLYRLSRAGFIELVRVAPHTYLLNLDSWWNHLARCAEDAEFWEKDGRARAAYRKAL